MPIIGTKKLIKLEVLNWTDAALFLFSLEVTNSAAHSFHVSRASLS